MNMALAIALFLIPKAEGFEGKDGDGGKSWGPYQITQGCLNDVNKFTDYKINYTKQDCYDPIIARRICIIYLTHYGNKIGRVPTVEDYCRIHNAGPDGWMENCSLAYWTKCVGHWALAQRNGQLAEALKG